MLKRFLLVLAPLWVGCASVKYTPPREALIQDAALSYQIGCLEALWEKAGDNDLSQIQKTCSQNREWYRSYLEQAIHQEAL